MLGGMMTHSELIDRLGGTSKVAELFRITPQAVSYWRRNGIPQARLMYLCEKYPEIMGQTPACAA